MKIRSRLTSTHQIRSEKKVKHAGEKKRNINITPVFKNDAKTIIDNIKQKIRNREIKGFHETVKSLTAELLRKGVGSGLDEARFQRMVEIVAKTVEKDPVLSGFIRRNFHGISND